MPGPARARAGAGAGAERETMALLQVPSSEATPTAQGPPCCPPLPPFAEQRRLDAVALGAELRGVAERQRAVERSRLRAEQGRRARSWAADAALARRQSQALLVARLLREHRLRCAMAERERVAPGRMLEFRALSELGAALSCAGAVLHVADAAPAPPRPGAGAGAGEAGGGGGGR